MTLDTVFDIPAHVVARRVGDETVILDLETGLYFGLDPVGARIWELMGDGHSIRAMRDAMLAEYEVEAEVLERDLFSLATDLAERRLVETRE